MPLAVLSRLLSSNGRARLATPPMAVGRSGGLSPGVLSASVKGESWHHCSVPGSPSTLTPERTPVTGGARVWRGRGRVLPPPPCMARAWTSWTAPHWATWVRLHSDTLRIWGRESNPCSPRSPSGAPAVAGTRRAYRARVAASCRPRGRWCCCSCTGCRGMPRSLPRRAGPETSGARSRPRGPASGGAMLPLCRRKRKQTHTVVRASCWDKKHGGQPRGAPGPGGSSLHSTCQGTLCPPGTGREAETQEWGNGTLTSCILWEEAGAWAQDLCRGLWGAPPCGQGPSAKGRRAAGLPPQAGTGLTSHPGFHQPWRPCLWSC